MPHWKFGLSETLRRGLAHYRYRRRLRRSRGFRKTARIIRTTDAVGDRVGRNPTGWSPGNVRLDDQELSSGPRRAEWSHCRVTCFEEFHELGTKSRGEVWLAECGEYRSQR